MDKHNWMVVGDTTSLAGQARKTTKDGRSGERTTEPTEQLFQTCATIDSTLTGAAYRKVTKLKNPDASYRINVVPFVESPCRF